MPRYLRDLEEGMKKKNYVGYAATYPCRTDYFLYCCVQVHRSPRHWLRLDYLRFLNRQLSLCLIIMWELILLIYVKNSWSVNQKELPIYSALFLLPYAIGLRIGCLFGLHVHFTNSPELGYVVNSQTYTQISVKMTCDLQTSTHFLVCSGELHDSLIAYMVAELNK